MNNQKSTNTISIVGLIFAFLFSPIGLVLSIIGLNNAKKENSSKTCSIIGIVVSSISLVFVIIAFIFDFLLWPGMENNIRKSTYCSSAFSCKDISGSTMKSCSYCKTEDCSDIGTINCPTK